MKSGVEPVVPIIQTVIITSQPVQQVIKEPGPVVTLPVVQTVIVTATRSAPLPTRTQTPTRTSTSTATIYPRAALLTVHERYVTAKGEVYGWVLRQETNKDDPCARFTLSSQTDSRIALKTCNERYVTAPATGSERADWLLRQELELDVCGLFTLVHLGSDKFALVTCAGRYITAGDWGWEGDLEWVLVAETAMLLEWEEFKLVRLQ